MQNVKFISLYSEYKTVYANRKNNTPPVIRPQRRVAPDPHTSCCGYITRGSGSTRISCFKTCYLLQFEMGGMPLSKLLPYSRELPYGYAPGIFPSLALVDTRPDVCMRLLLHSKAQNGDGMESLRARCAALGIREETADRALRTLSRKDNCFAAVVFEKYVCTLLETHPHVVLHQPSDMGNMGAIFRTCLGFGFTDIAVIRPAADCYDPRVVRASMGAVFAINIAAYDTFDAYRTVFPAHTIVPFMLGNHMPLSLAAAKTKEPYALVFGNEAKGLPDSFAALGQAVRIPHSDAIDSLNLAVAVGIAAYAFCTERKNTDG